MKSSLKNLILRITILIVGAALFVILAEVMKWILQIVVVVFAIVGSIFLVWRHLHGTAHTPIQIKRKKR